MWRYPPSESKEFFIKDVDMDKYLEKIEKTESCWLWKGKLNHAGYGRVSVKGKNVFIHRLIYELAVGKIPDGLQIDHKCFTRNCVNPEHLEPVTGSENIRRAWHRRIQNNPNCKYGHPLSGWNLIIATRKDRGELVLYRRCRQCTYDITNRHRERQRAKSK